MKHLYNLSCRYILLTLLIFITHATSAQLGPHEIIFESQVTFPDWVRCTDFDMDGHKDVVLKNTYPTGVFFFRNAGAGVFEDPVTLLTGTQGSGSETRFVDLDNDGDEDLAGKNVWFRNDGPGLTLTPMGNYLAGYKSSSLFKDLDGDGDRDDVGIRSGQVVTMMNNGNGLFTLADTLGPAIVNFATIFSSAEDVNGDMIIDLMIGGDNAQVGLFPGLGSGAFGLKISIADYTLPACPLLFDADTDGDFDLLSFDYQDGIYHFTNDGNGNFILSDSINVNEAVSPEVIADINGDGVTDLSVGTGTTCNVIIRYYDNGQWNNQNIELFNGYNLSGTTYANGDLDNDGDEDLIFASGLSIAGWFRNDGNGNVSRRKNIGKLVSFATDVAVADADLNGFADLAVPSANAGFISLHLNNGDETFTREIITDSCQGVTELFFSDINNDGRPDLLTNKAEFSIYKNTAGGWVHDVLPGNHFAKIAIDADADFDDDLVCNGALLRNDGSGNFTIENDADIPVLYATKSADINGDGFTDIISADPNGDTLNLLINDGNGNFDLNILPASCFRLDIADMDADGDPDITCISQTFANVTILTNDGNGNFTDSLQYSSTTSFYSRDIVATDFNKDGFPDVVWSVSNGYTHHIYLNLNDSTGQLGPAILIDPSANVTQKMVMADMNNDLVEDLLTTQYFSILWRENYFYNVYRVRGSVFYDYDLNAIYNPGEHKIPFQLVRSDANNYLAWTNSNGDFDLSADTGTWNVWSNPSAAFQVTNNPDSIIATLDTLNTIQSGIDFGWSPVALDSGSLFSITIPQDFSRCNHTSLFWVNVQNTGTFILENAIIDVYMHPDLDTSYFSINPDSISGDHYYWHIDSLGWFQQWQVKIGVETGPINTFNNISALLTYGTDTIYRSEGGIVTCAYDPNDKLVTPQGYGIYGAVDINTDWLNYTVRFQNTGNAAAENVFIKDQLDAALDWSSMMITATSHPLTAIEVNPEGEATFRFDNIMLPDSGTDYFASNGFIQYRIKPSGNPANFTEIHNTAGIYFDYNLPVVTNTTLNTLVDCNLFAAQINTTPDDSLMATTGEFFQWFLDGDSIQGANSQVIYPVDPGIYTVNVTTIYGCSDLSDPLQIVGYDEITIPSFTIFPNPNSGRFVISCEQEYDAIEILDLSGRILQSLTGTKKVWEISGMNTTAAGLYLIRAIKEGQQPVVRKMVLQ